MDYDHFTLAYWIGSFAFECTLLGILMYTLICLSDLEHDFINPHDFTAKTNRLVVPEYIVHGLHILYLLAGQKWLVLGLNLPLALWHLRCYINKKAYIDVTEVFNELPREKKTRLIKLGIYLVVMVIVLYRVVHSAVLVVWHTSDTYGHAAWVQKVEAPLDATA